MRHATDQRLPQSGITLVEMIISIVVGGILIALVGMFGRWQIQSYFDIYDRAALTDAADIALRHMAREIQSALPNSVRVNTSGDGNLLEYVPIVDAGRYRAYENLSGTGNVLNILSPTATVFDVLGPAVDVAAGQSLVIYNLGIPGADVYEGTSRRGLSGTGTGLTSLGFTGGQFPFASPANRFHIVGSPVTFQCDVAGKVIRRHSNYGYLDPQPASAAGLAGTPPILVGNVSACKFDYTPGALQRNGLVSISLALTANGETVNLLRQVEVLNTP